MGAMIISCSRDNDNTNPTTPQTPAISQTVILPTKLTYSQTGKADEVITFSYDGNKLVKATRDNKDVIYTYTGDLITSVNDANQTFYVFHYDSNGNLISEEQKSYSGTIKVSEENITYNINGSIIIAQKIYKQYDDFDGTLSSTTTSTITYTLDTKKRPIRRVEVSEKKDAAGILTLSKNNTFTYQYVNHNNMMENIKGMDKLFYYSSLAEGGEDTKNIFLPVSYIKEEINRTHYHFGTSYNN
ncbi:MAG: hypothetical protein ACFNQA_06630, partial [Flavobacteriaceae bacterium]